MPGRIANLMQLAGREARAEFVTPQVFPAQGARRMRVLLLAGCAQQALDAEINAATIRVLTRHGCEVVIAEGAGCCGALPLHMGCEEEGRALARRNVDAWSLELAGGVDAVVVNASGCGTTVKDYGHLLNDESARRIGTLAHDVTEILATLDLNVVGDTRRYRVAYHDACSLQHGQRVLEPPRRLLAAGGFEVIDLPEKHFCCGSAGTYNLLQPDIARTLGQRKAAHAESVDPDIIAAGNLGCMVQIGRYTDLPMLHTVSLIDWATGGPLPAALRGRKLREPQQQPTMPEANAGAAAPASSNESGFW
jgi:glycolate oxidase iron-sulfur subunit